MIRGAPGIGKSTLARALRDALQRGAVLEVDDFRGMQAIDWESEAQHDIALEVALVAAARFAGLGVRPLILVDTFCGGRLAVAQRRLSELGKRHSTVSLWLEPDVLRARLEARESGFKCWPSSRGVNTEIRANRYPSETMIDVGELAPERLVERVARLLLQGLHPQEPAPASP